MKLVAKTMAGLEPVLASELEGIGAAEIRIAPRAIYFEGDHEVMYRANFELRTPLRILLPIADFQVRNENDLYRHVFDIDWQQYMGVENTFAIDAVVWSETMRHSHFAALKTKDAIADRFRKETGRRPDVNVHEPDLRVHLHISGQAASLSLDSSGESLHRRGYRTRGGMAPLNETLAAGMIMLSGWKGDRPFIDPMCGSGTLLIEAALIAGRIPPQWQRRHFGFMRWRDFQPELWEKVRRRALMSPDVEWPLIFGSDRDFKAIRTSQDVLPFYKSIGDQLKQRFAGYDVWIISAHQEALKQVGLRPSRRITLFNGPLECKYQLFQMYEGSKRVKTEQE
jgi:putative N6-adenine-specific DNA methylase